ncbi:MAG: PIG-L family deacetylase [Armatimonadetes bacterium]|nr:PIG-L family deacetylase [Armatimonadota bacterium]MDE2205195.1 PIG-L family deacetylase [Armatimonadota bacterium]
MVRRAIRALILGLTVVLVYFGGQGAAFVYRHHLANEVGDAWHFAPVAGFSRRTRFLVIAPHPDDEALGASGAIQQTLEAGGAVCVVVVTNGDGFATAVKRQFRTMTPTPANYVAFGEMRQQETLRAMRVLGVPSANVDFLGYPDGGVNHIWMNHWSPLDPYLSRDTRSRRSPYTLAYRQGAPYCGAAILADLRQIMVQFQPTVIAVCHPDEDHPDHRAVAAFTDLALQTVRDGPSPPAWSRSALLIHYLIHRGDWPLPQGLDARDPLLPPAEMAALDTQWRELPVTTGQEENKEQAIRMYATQMAIMQPFLQSFVRATELYGTIQEGSVPILANQAGLQHVQWSAVVPALLDPVRDNMLADLQGSGDIRALYVCHDSRRVYFRMELRQRPTQAFRYSFTVRPFREVDLSPDAALEVDVGAGGKNVADPPGLTTKWTSDSVQASVPIADLDPSTDHPLQFISISGTASLAGVTVDVTGARILAW